MRFHQRVCDGKSKAEATKARMNRGIALFEKRKYSPQRLRRNTNPGITYFDHEPAALVVVGYDRNRPAERRELQRISDQVRQNLFQLACVSSDMAMPGSPLQVDADCFRFLLTLRGF